MPAVSIMFGKRRWHARDPVSMRLVTFSSFEQCDLAASLAMDSELGWSFVIAYTIVGGQLYVYAGDTKTEWVQHMEVDPQVRFRRKGLIYELRAKRVTDDTERAAFAKAWAAREFFSRDPQTLDEVWLYRLRPRRSASLTRD